MFRLVAQISNQVCLVFRISNLLQTPRIVKISELSPNGSHQKPQHFQGPAPLPQGHVLADSKSISASLCEPI